MLPSRGGAGGAEFTLPSGRRVRWISERAPVVDQDATLELEVREPDGAPSPLEPFMGMLSHAAVTTPGGDVFVHLHPAGSISMAAMARFEAGAGASGGPPPTTAMAMPMSAAVGIPGAGETNVVRFPFVFPTAGDYRVFVQIKVAGQVETAAFDVPVR